MGNSIRQGADLCTLRVWVLRADISKTQDAEVGDGTTSVVVLAGELLREAEKLVSQKIHPMTIISGAECSCALCIASESLIPHRALVTSVPALCGCIWPKILYPNKCCRVCSGIEKMPIATHLQAAKFRWEGIQVQNQCINLAEMVQGIERPVTWHTRGWRRSR